MFDELDNSRTTPPASAQPLGPTFKSAAPISPSKAEDIFADTDKPARPEIFRPNPNNPEPPRGTVLPPPAGLKSNKMMVFSLLFGGLAVVIAGGYFGLKLAVNSQSAVNNTEIQVQPVNTEIQAETPPVGEINNAATEPPAEPAATEPIAPAVTAPIDSDLDGLTNDEEAMLGTDANNSDTDQDGLTDREEAKVYGTNPLNSDTDGDGYTDGSEIENGYNPKGPGKLLDINNR